MSNNPVKIDIALTSNKIDVSELASDIESIEIELYTYKADNGYKTMLYYPMNPAKKITVGCEVNDKDWEQKDFKEGEYIQAVEYYNSIPTIEDQN